MFCLPLPSPPRRTRRYMYLAGDHSPRQPPRLRHQRQRPPQPNRGGPVDRKLYRRHPSSSPPSLRPRSRRWSYPGSPRSLFLFRGWWCYSAGEAGGPPTGPPVRAEKGLRLRDEWGGWAWWGGGCGGVIAVGGGGWGGRVGGGRGPIDHRHGQHIPGRDGAHKRRGESQPRINRRGT